MAGDSSDSTVDTPDSATHDRSDVESDDLFDPAFDESPESGDELDGFVTIRDSLYGLLFLWVAVLSAVTTVQIVVFSLFHPAVLVGVMTVGATISVVTGYRSLQILGLKPS